MPGEVAGGAVLLSAVRANVTLIRRRDISPSSTSHRYFFDSVRSKPLKFGSLRGDASPSSSSSSPIDVQSSCDAVVVGADDDVAGVVGQHDLHRALSHT